MAVIEDNNKPVSGTREWAVAEINCCRGCPHGCRYCYARYDQVERRKVVSPDEWQSCRVMEDEVNRKRPLYPGQVMFPTAHDIVPENIDACIKLLRNLIKAGNRVLVVSKPHLDCISALCREFDQFKHLILFRFTITARNDRILKFWEPFAPDYKERKKCLEHARLKGFRTSVSIEPMLDTEDVVSMVHELCPFISHSIWLGKMNKIEQRITCDSVEMEKEIERIKKGQSDAQLFCLYRELAEIPQVRWKESVKKILGLPQATDPGLDI